MSGKPKVYLAIGGDKIVRSFGVTFSFKQSLVSLVTGIRVVIVASLGIEYYDLNIRPIHQEIH